MNISDIVKEFSKGIGKVYLVSAFVPTFLFSLIVALLGMNMFPSDMQNLETTSNLVLLSTLVFLTLWISLALHSGASVTVKIFEGYYLPIFFVKLLVFLQRQWHAKKTKYIQEYKKASNLPSRERKQKQNKLRPFVLSELNRLGIRAPIDPVFLQPTLLGNISFASRYYPQERYGIDGGAFWSRLSTTLPSEYKENLAEQNAYLLFMLNSALLAFIVSFLSLFIGFGKLFCGSFYLRQCLLFQTSFAWNADVYFVLTIAFALIGYISYRTGANIAESYGLLICTAFDIYRFRLLESLNQPMPTSLQAEWGVWRALSEFCVAGQHLGPIQFTYKFLQRKPSDK